MINVLFADFLASEINQMSPLNHLMTMYLSSSSSSSACLQYKSIKISNIVVALFRMLPTEREDSTQYYLIL